MAESIATRKSDTKQHSCPGASLARNEEAAHPLGKGADAVAARPAFLIDAGQRDGAGDIARTHGGGIRSVVLVGCLAASGKITVGVRSSCGAKDGEELADLRRIADQISRPVEAAFSSAA